MIQHDDGLRPVEKRLAFYHRTACGVDNNQHGVVITQFDRALMRDKDLFLIVAAFPQHLQPVADRHRVLSDHDPRLFSQRLCRTVDPDRRTQRVHVGNPVAHRKHPVFRLHNLAHCLRFDSGLDPCMALRAMGLSAIELHLPVPVEHRLVASASQRHLDRAAGIFIILVVVVAAHTGADADRHNRFVSDIDGLDLLKQRKMILLNAFQTFLIHNQKILVFFQFLAQRMMRQAVFVDLTVNQDIHKRGMDFVHIFHGFLVIVQVDQRHHRLFFAVLSAQLTQFRLIDEVDDIMPAAPLRGGGILRIPGIRLQK